MRSLHIIYWIIRKSAAKNGIVSVSYMSDLKRITSYRSSILPLSVHLGVLKLLGLIKFSRSRKQIALTQKGMVTGDLRVLQSGTMLILFFACSARVTFIYMVRVLLLPFLLLRSLSRYKAGRTRSQK